MKMIDYLIEKINENNTVKVRIKTYPKELCCTIITEWDCGYTGTTNLYSKEAVEAYLRGFYDALPF